MMATGVVRLVADTELKDINGTPLCAGRVAYSTGLGDRRVSNFVDLTVWGKSAETFSKHFGKGDPVFISGELSSREYEDKVYWGIKVLSWSFIPRTKDKGKKKETEAEAEAPFAGVADPDDLPF